MGGRLAKAALALVEDDNPQELYTLREEGARGDMWESEGPRVIDQGGNGLTQEKGEGLRVVDQRENGLTLVKGEGLGVIDQGEDGLTQGKGDSSSRENQKEELVIATMTQQNEGNPINSVIPKCDELEATGKGFKTIFPSGD